MAVKDIDRGWNRIKRQLKIADGSFTKIGVQQGEVRKNAEGGTSNMVVIAAVQEFGTEHIPARPAQRQAFDKNRRSILAFKDKMLNAVLDNKFSTKLALGLLGEFATAKVKSQITKLRTPPLKNPSIKRGGSGANPLVDTGQYRASITHVENI